MMRLASIASQEPSSDGFEMIASGTYDRGPIITFRALSLAITSPPQVARAWFSDLREPSSL
jgi:hypothetical protein